MTPRHALPLLLAATLAVLAACESMPAPVVQRAPSYARTSQADSSPGSGGSG